MNVEVRKRVLGEEHPDTLKSASNLAPVLFFQGDLSEAARTLRHTLEVKKRVLGSTHADTCFAALNLLSVWVEGEQASKLDEAEALVTATHATLSRDFGHAHPSALTAGMHHGAVLRARAAWRPWPWLWLWRQFGLPLPACRTP